MYYTHPCSYCQKVFYTYNSDKMAAAQTLYSGIKAHLIEYDEDDREYEFDEYPEKAVNKVYYEMREMNEPPHAGYELT